MRTKFFLLFIILPIFCFGEITIGKIIFEGNNFLNNNELSNIIFSQNGDIYDRYLVRVAELRQSREIVRQALKNLPAGPYKVDDNKISLPNRKTLKSSMEALIHHFKLVSEGVSVPKGETYVPIEGPRGEVGFYIVSDGSNVPSRVKLRAPSFMAIPGMCKMMEGCFIADVVGIIGSIDIVMGEVDR